MGPLFLTCLLLFFSFSGVTQKVRPVKVTAANARQYRDSLNLAIFGTTVFPYDVLPDSVISNVSDIDHYTGFPYNPILYPSGNLDSVDKMVVTIDASTANFPSKAKVYLFHPHNSNGKLFIYHSGHCAGAATAEDVMGNANGLSPGTVIPRLIAEGYTVLAVPMIHYQNNPPTGFVCGYNGHDPLFLDSLYAKPLALFFKPLIASLNQLGRSNYAAIYMTGLSGGGWTTSVYPAMDSSIRISIPVAGSWPIPVRNSYYTGGDSEQYYPPVFKDLLDYHELYTLACLAPARKMLQINNRYDECCFNGSVAHIFYVDSVKKALQGSGGVFSFYLDESDTRHAVTNRAMDVMLTFIANEEGSLLINPVDSVYGGMTYYYNIKNNFTVNTTPDNSVLQYSLLKGPEWLNLNTITGEITGQATPGTIIPAFDTVSFKVEDATGRFVIYNYRMTKKRANPFFFTMFEDSSTVYFLPFYSNAIHSINPLSSSYFYFNNPSLSVIEMSVENNSIIKIKLNGPLTATDSIGYNGLTGQYPVTYHNGLKMEDFGLSPVRFNAVKKNYARAGMIRFNTDTVKFEYFNGYAWVNMN